MDRAAGGASSCASAGDARKPHLGCLTSFCCSPGAQLARVGSGFTGKPGSGVPSARQA